MSHAAQGNQAAPAAAQAPVPFEQQTITNVVGERIRAGFVVIVLTSVVGAVIGMAYAGIHDLELRNAGGSGGSYIPVWHSLLSGFLIGFLISILTIFIWLTYEVIQHYSAQSRIDAANRQAAVARNLLANDAATRAALRTNGYTNFPAPTQFNPYTATLEQLYQTPAEAAAAAAKPAAAATTRAAAAAP